MQTRPQDEARLPKGKKALFARHLIGWLPSTCLDVLGRGGPGRIVTDHLYGEFVTWMHSLGKFDLAGT